MAPSPTTLSPVLGTETLPGAADLAQEVPGAGAADETLGQAGPRVTGPRVDEPRARRLAGSATHPRVALRRDVTRFSGDSYPTVLLGHLGHVRPVDETRPAAETSARVDYPRVDRPGVGHFGVEQSWPLAFVPGFEPEFWVYPSAALSAFLPERASEELLVPALPPERAPSSSDLIGEIFGGEVGSRESRPLLAPHIARTVPSEAAQGPDVFRNRIVRSVLSGGEPPKPPRPFSQVLDPLGTGEFIMNPLTTLLALDKIQAANPVVLEVMRAEDSVAVALRLAGLKTEIYQSIDAIFAELGELETSGVFDGARIGLRLAYDKALTRVSQIFTQARQAGLVILGLQDVEALLTLAGYREGHLSSFFGYDVGRYIGVMELTRLIQGEILAPLGAQRRTYDVFQVLNLAKLHAPGVANTGSQQGTAVPKFPGIALDARSLRPEERRDDENSDATDDTPLVVGPTASRDANADAEDQGEQRDNSSQ